MSLVVLAAMPMVAQETPDFSGRWVLVSPSQPAPDVSRVVSVRQSIVRTNVRGEPMKPFVRALTVTRELDDGAHAETYQVGIVGGSVSGVRANGSLGPDTHTHHRTVWEGQALIIEHGTSIGPTPRSGSWSERREVWTLDAAGRLNMVITTSGSDVAFERVSLVYRRE